MKTFQQVVQDAISKGRTITFTPDPARPGAVKIVVWKKFGAEVMAVDQPMDMDAPMVHLQIDGMNEAMNRGEEREMCRRCGGRMKDSQAIAQTFTGRGDFSDDDEVVTMSPGGPGALVDCRKCSECGWSVSDDELDARLAMMDGEDGGGCPECHGEGVVYDCHTEYACVDPESGCDLCKRRCGHCA